MELGSMELTFESIRETLTSNNVPEIVMAVAGVLAIIIVYAYLKDKDSMSYKFMVLLGLIVGVLLAVISVWAYETWALSSTVILIVAAFTLVIRPFRETNFAVLIALLAMALVYVLLGNLAGGTFDFIATEWPRIVITLIVGALIYSLMHFAQSLVQAVGKILNWWPLLLILGIVCIIEAYVIFKGYGSIYDYIRTYLEV